MKNSSIRRTSIFIGVIVIASCALSYGIRVSPATIILQEAPVGELYDFMAREGLSIVIGPVDYDISYILSCEPASKGSSTATGYFDFPEPSWFILAHDSVHILKGDIAEIPMWLNIPAHDGYYNHHWLLGIPISPSKADIHGPQIQVGAYLLFRIETKAKKGVRPICAPNEVVSVPSRLVFDNLIPGKPVSEVLNIYYGGERSGIYSVKRLDPESPVAEITIKGTPGFPRLENTSWVQFPDTIVIPGKKEGPGILPITVSVPHNPGVRRFEEILMIESTMTRPAFVRILVMLKQE